MAGFPTTVSFPLETEGPFDEIIDVRSPAEFAEDHISDAINLPVLDDGQRAEIGTRYKQDSSFEAKKAGAALVSTNIARHLEGHFALKPKNYRPLIYCFRGGHRSFSLATVMAAVGWPVSILEGGYKAYRRHVLTVTEKKSDTLRFHVLNGLTGSRKTRLLEALDSLGAQVLDLEGLANHKGSVFGGDFETPQPPQKQFETFIFEKLSGFSEARPVFVEAESAKIGRLNLPLPLIAKMRESEVTEIVSPIEARVEFLHREYEPWLSAPEKVLEMLDMLEPIHSAETIQRWRSKCAAGSWRELIKDLLIHHYDKRYGRDGGGKYREPVRQISVDEKTGRQLPKLAAELIESTSCVAAETSGVSS